MKPAPIAGGRMGVRIVGSSHVLPERRLTNADLEKIIDTSDDWIVQRTGVRERRISDPSRGESAATLAPAALRLAIADAGIDPTQLDLVVCATMTADMPTPSVACQASSEVGATRAGAFDLNAACSGFIFGLNCVHDLIRGGAYRTIALVGVDVITRHCDYTNAGRGTSILFGDGAGVIIMRRCDDPALGVIAQSMHADGGGWKDLFIPSRAEHFPGGVADPMNEGAKVNTIQMNGRAVFKFAVSTFSDLIAETLEKAGLGPDAVDMYVCHQSNARILQAARDRFGIAEEKLYINIDRVGNTVAASVPICFDELRRAGRIRDGHRVMFVAFGAGLTWGSSLWQL